MSNSSPAIREQHAADSQPKPPPPPHDLLLTPKALELFLSPPRAPPFGSAQRAWLTGNHHGQHPQQLSWTQRHYRVREEAQHDDNDHDNDDEAHSRHHPHETLRQRLHDQLVQRRRRSKQQRNLFRHHPHLPERSADAVTRTVGAWWSVARQHRFRDNGTFRSVADCLVAASVPLLALSQPRAARQFWQLSSSANRQEIRYGPHPLQCMDLFVPHNNDKPKSPNSTTAEMPQQPPPRLVLFVHGGAWGSGKKWMYRLVAAPYLARGWAVAIPGYRTYPDGTAVEQVRDVERAAAVLRQYLSSWFAEENSTTTTKVTLMGHSSGAHIALLMLVERAREKMLQFDVSGSLKKRTDTAAAAVQKLQPEAQPPPEQRLLPVDSFVGLSGPYDISHHFDYEAGRGVEELSPMKPANGHTRANFRLNSPAARFRDAVLGPCRGSQQHCLAAAMPRRLALLHGVEDDTVPFTATADAARLLRSCGVTAVDEVYVPETGHQDMVLQVMLGGPARDATVEWIRNLDKNDAKQDSAGRIKLNSASAATKNPPPQQRRMLHARSML